MVNFPGLCCQEDPFQPHFGQGDGVWRPCEGHEACIQPRSTRVAWCCCAEGRPRESVPGGTRGAGLEKKWWRREVCGSWMWEGRATSVWGLGAVRAAETCGPTGTPRYHFGGTEVARTLLGLKEDSWKGGLLFFSFPFPPFFEIFSNLNDSPSLFRAVVQWVTVVAGGRLDQMVLEVSSNLAATLKCKDDIFFPQGLLSNCRLHSMVASST